MIEYPACVFLKKPIRQFIPLITHLKKYMLSVGYANAPAPIAIPVKYFQT